MATDWQELSQPVQDGEMATMAAEVPRSEGNRDGGGSCVADPSVLLDVPTQAREADVLQPWQQQQQQQPEQPEQPEQQQQQQQQQPEQQQDDDTRSWQEKLEQMQREPPPPELSRRFYHATVAQKRSLLAQSTHQVDAFVSTLRGLILRNEGSEVAATAADVGLFDPSLRGTNDFIGHASTVSRQWELAAEQSGVLFVCLGEGDLKDGWHVPVLNRAAATETVATAPSGVVAPTTATTADVVLVFLDADSLARHTTNDGCSKYLLDDLLSNPTNLARMLERSTGRRRRWLINQESRLRRWQREQAMQRLLEERDVHHQERLTSLRLLSSCRLQRNLQFEELNSTAASGAGTPDVWHCCSGCTSSQILSVDTATSGCCGSYDWLSPDELVKYSCSQKSVDYYFEGDNWKKLCSYPKDGVIVLFGMRGVGKTQTALHYASYIAEAKAYTPTFVYLFHFETPEALTTAIETLEGHLRIAPETTPCLRDRFTGVVCALKQPSYSGIHKVLILDGASEERFSDVLSGLCVSYLEQLQDRRKDLLFLVTSHNSRKYDCIGAFYRLEIHPLTFDEVQKVMRRDSYFSNVENLSSLAKKFRAELGGLPVGIFPALSFIKRTSCSPDRYLRSIDDPIVAADAMARSPYRHTVRQAIRLSIDDLLGKQRPTESFSRIPVALLAACFARQQLPTSLLCRCFMSSTNDNELSTDACERMVYASLSELKSACLFENDFTKCADVPVVTVHKIVHEIMRDTLLSLGDQLIDALDLALRGAFLEVELDLRQHCSREHAILLHPHVCQLTGLALRNVEKLATRRCALVCLVYLLHASAYVQVEAGNGEGARHYSELALEQLCQMLGSTAKCTLDSITQAQSDVSSFAAHCPMAKQIDRLAVDIKMSTLLSRRRASGPWTAVAEHPSSVRCANQDERAERVRRGAAVDSATMDAAYPYELLSAVLYMYGRAHASCNPARAEVAYRLCLALCEHVRAAHGVQLIYTLLAERSGLLALQLKAIGSAGGSAADDQQRLRAVLARYEQLSTDDKEYFQMGVLKVKPCSDDVNQLICSMQIILTLRKLHRSVVEQSRFVAPEAEACGAESYGKNDPASRLKSEALSIQRQSFQHAQIMLKLATQKNDTSLGRCYIECGHLTLQMLSQRGSSHAVPYYRDGLNEMVKANMVMKMASAIVEIADCHRQFGRVPSDTLCDVLEMHTSMARDGSCGTCHVEEAQARLNLLRAVRELSRVLKSRCDDKGGGSKLLAKTFNATLKEAEETLPDEQLAYAWRDAASSMGYTDAGIIRECQQLLQPDAVD